jgi:hypothetical protein
MKRFKFLSLLMILAVACLAVQLPVSHAEDLTSYLPISSVTPGATNPAVTQSNIASTICTSGYTKTIRPSSSYTTALKIKQLAGTYKRYGSTKTSLVEEDHLIPLEIGGSPKSVDNLWAQLWDGAWGARKKDQLENKIHTMVCSKAMTLAKAQAIFATNWIDGFKVYVLGQAQDSTSESTSPLPSPSPSISVTRSFTMPFFTDRIGSVIANWSKTGFTQQPIIVQDSVPAGLACKPLTDNDIIVKQEPKWKEVVSADTQVKLTLLCDAYVVKTATPTPQPTAPSRATASPTPAPTVTSISPTQSPTPASTPVVVAPTPSPTLDHPATATGKCKDGTFSYAATHSGMCSGHGGVAQFYP